MTAFNEENPRLDRIEADMKLVRGEHDSLLERVTWAVDFAAFRKETAQRLEALEAREQATPVAAVPAPVASAPAPIEATPETSATAPDPMVEAKIEALSIVFREDHEILREVFAVVCRIATSGRFEDVERLAALKARIEGVESFR
jgi:hypothetical protein